MGDIFILIGVVGIVVAVWGVIKLPKDITYLNKGLRDSYMGGIIRKYIRDHFLKK